MSGDDFYGPQSFSVIHPVHEGNKPLIPFAHALKIAMEFKGNIEIIDFRKNRSRPAPGVRKMLEMWGRLPSGSEREDVSKLDMGVKKVIKKNGTVKDTMKRLKKHDHDLIVVGCSTSRGVRLFPNSELSQSLSQEARQTTLYIPDNCYPFVEPSTGEYKIEKILVPVAEEPGPEPAFEFLKKFLGVFNKIEPSVIGLHCGGSFPYISAVSLEGLSWKELLINEPVTRGIIKAVKKEKPSLVVMATNGRDSFRQKIVGGITENILYSVKCPVLAVAVR